jgi:ornithine cyclodeaminase/alanine dehydrogenase-like protein (mu-crystallin family)
MLILTAIDVRNSLDPVALRQALASGYEALSEGRADIPVRTMTRSAEGLLGAMPGYVEGVGLGAKLVSVFSGNAPRGLPSHLALVALFDENTGVPLALMDGEVITEMRTSASAALACDLLAPADARILTIVGAGVQARGHLTALSKLRPWAEIRLANRTVANAQSLAARHCGVTVYGDIDEAVRGADVVACTTDSTTPLFSPASFSGRHLSSVGLHLEIPPDLLEGAEVVVQTRSAVHTPPPNGPVAVQGMDPGAVTELGEVVAGRRAGRSGDRMTAWLSVGNAMEDVVAARLAYEVATENGLGQTISL